MHPQRVVVVRTAQNVTNAAAVWRILHGEPVFVVDPCRRVLRVDTDVAARDSVFDACRFADTHRQDIVPATWNWQSHTLQRILVEALQVLVHQVPGDAGRPQRMTTRCEILPQVPRFHIFQCGVGVDPAHCCIDLAALDSLRE